MKTLSLSLLIVLFNCLTLAAQRNSPKANQLQVETSKEDGVTLIQWSSNKEVNSSYYLIQKSVDGIHFQTIGTEKAGSSTFHATNYSFEFVEEQEENLTYRISLVFMDGKVITALPENNEEPNFANTLAE